MQNVGKPVLPTEKQEVYPTKQGSNVKQSFRQISKRINKIKKDIKPVIEQAYEWKVQDIAAGMARNYRFELDPNQYAMVSQWIQEIYSTHLLDSPQMNWTQGWWLNFNLNKAYEQGAKDALNSAKGISLPSVVGQELAQEVRSITIEQITFSDGYRRRVGNVFARVFEEMKGLTLDSKKDLADTLARSIASGQGIEDATKSVMKRVDVSKSRAEKISRTEINGAYTRAYGDESDQFNETIYESSEWQTRLMHQSAFAPTSRTDHMRRTGTIATNEEQEEWWATKATGGRINCLCTTIMVLYNTETGEVMQSELVKRVKQRKKQFLPES